MDEYKNEWIRRDLNEGERKKIKRAAKNSRGKQVKGHRNT